MRWLNHRVGSGDVDHFTRAADLPALLAEMSAAGIGTGVMVGRSTPTVRIGNDELAALQRRSGERLLGVNFDAGFYARPLRADANELMPLYEACQQEGVPAFVMSGPTTPDLAFNDPLAIDNVARTFPKLPIVCCHGFYPRVADIVAVAFRHENVLVSPDMYLFSPGGGLYVEAANGFMAEQLLFGSSYPCRPMAQGVQDLGRIGLQPDVLDKVLGRNARRLLALD